MKTGLNWFSAGATCVTSVGRRRSFRDVCRGSRCVTGGAHCYPVQDVPAVWVADLDDYDACEPPAEDVAVRRPHPGCHPRRERVNGPMNNDAEAPDSFALRRPPIQLTSRRVGVDYDNAPSRPAGIHRARR